MLRLVPDTGASSLVLFNPDQKLDIRRASRVATLRTTSAQTEVRVAQVPELRVGNVTLTNVPAVRGGAPHQAQAAWREIVWCAGQVHGRVS
jgi:predicted aspartyl protease